MPASRPLSPHLQVYRWPITMVLSICHRTTGVALAVGTLLLVWWLVALATGPQAFAAAQAFIGSWLGQLMLLGWSLSLFFHLANGIRHLVWDTGHGYSIKAMNSSSWLVIVTSVALTAIAWIAGLASMAG